MINRSTIGTQQKKNEGLILILSGIALYYAGYIIHDFILDEATWTRLINMFGTGLFLLGFLYIPKNLRGTDKPIRGFIIFFALVCFIYLLIGIPILLIEGKIPELLFHRERIWMFFLAFLLFVRIEKTDLKILVKWSVGFAISSMLFSLYNFDDFFQNPEDLMRTMIGYDPFVVDRPQQPAILLFPICSFAVLYPNYSFKLKLFLAAAIIFALAASLFVGRRSISAMLIGFILIPLFVYAWEHKFKTLLYVFPIFTILSFYLFDRWDCYSDTLVENFPILSDRIDADTRSGTEIDFYKDMDEPIDWIFGRGMAGTYYSPSVADVSNLNRGIIETGYLNIILHGGLVTLLPFVSILAYAFFMGFFRSQNIVLKNFATIVLYYILLLYPLGTPSMSYHYILLFLFVRICISKQYRNMNNEEIKMYLHI